MRIETLTIVGVGLIGGSIGLAAKRRGVAGTVLGASRDPRRLKTALARGAIDEACAEFSSAVHRANLAVFCAPVDQIASQVLAAAPGCKPGTILCDAGSTKSQIVNQIEPQLRGKVSFVGSHPLAGSEKRGVEHADADLFQGRLTILTRTARTDAAALDGVDRFWRSLGSRTRVMNPEEHDRALALTSHLPHLVASALCRALGPEFYDLTAAGFRDTTRIAAGEPSIWTPIFRHNKAALLEALDQLEIRLDEFRNALVREDAAALDALLGQGKDVRDALGN
jgi:prephenate dehydrogenase